MAKPSIQKTVGSIRLTVKTGSEQYNPSEKQWQRRAGKAWPSAAWIHGEGPHALVAPCGRGTTVSLWLTEEEAKSQKAIIDESGCGGNCFRWEHRILDLRDIRKCWLPDHAANKAAIRDHQKINRCCVPYCRREADYAVLARESFLGIRGERTIYSKCPLMCAGHVDDYGLLDEREAPLDEGLTVVRLAEPGGVQ
ncbi:MAG: hypothetical protein O2795_17875 [Acidobacteria bacterium]|nr:hypothetical protein [Acidobacteriota bacterium]